MFLWCVVMLSLFGRSPDALADQRAQTGSLRITVHDPSGAVVPGAGVRIKGTEGAAAEVTLDGLLSDGLGVAIAPNLVTGKYAIEVSFLGFETRIVPDVRVRTGDNRRDVTLAIQKVDQSVSVGRDPSVCGCT